jgi:hypothetical protein
MANTTLHLLPDDLLTRRITVGEIDTFTIFNF